VTIDFGAFKMEWFVTLDSLRHMTV